jgi:predicted RNA-binding protein with PIN domain
VPYWFDGNNLIGQPVAVSARERNTRKAFLATLSQYARARRTRVSVYFDGDDPERSNPPARVEIRYCAPLTADEAILRDLRGRRSPAEVIVVTNDRELGARCRGEGASCIPWSDFSARLRHAVSNADRMEQKEEVARLQDWAEYFGFDKNSLE